MAEEKGMAMLLHCSYNHLLFSLSKIAPDNMCCKKHCGHLGVKKDQREMLLNYYVKNAQKIVTVLKRYYQPPTFFNYPRLSFSLRFFFCHFLTLQCAWSLNNIEMCEWDLVQHVYIFEICHGQQQFAFVVKKAGPLMCMTLLKRRGKQ